MTPIHLSLFGGFEARLPDGQLARLGTRKSEALLAFLACRPGEPHSRDRLAAMFWGDGSDRAARHSLRQAIAALRRLSGPQAPILCADRDTVTLDEGAIDADVVAFEELRAADTASSLAAAARLYRGPLLDGFGVREEPFEEWLEHKRAGYHDRAVRLLLRLSELAPDGEIATTALLRALELEPSCEDAHRRLIRSHIDAANYNAAIRQYTACVEVLRRDLDASPEPPTTALHREALASRERATLPSHPERIDDVSFGERKYVTVLCAVLTTTLSADNLGDPERTQEALEPVLQELRAIASRDGGNVLGETSDELIVVFGAPIARENHAADACRAAADMLTALQRRTDVVLHPSIGIDSGEVVVRTRDRSLLPAGVFGYCLRRATRLARTGQMPIGATEATFALASRFWRFAAAGMLALDPQSPPLPLYAPIGPWPGSSGLDHFPTHLLSRFIGRREELAALAAALEPVAAGRGRIVAVVGEPGIGKSRLFHEFVRDVAEEWRVVACRGDPQLADVPYAPIAKAVRACLGIGADEHARDALQRAVRALDPTLSRSLSALSSLLEIETPDATWHALEPAQKRHQIVSVVTTLFRLVAERRALVLVVEDLHWLDPASRNVLERLTEVLPTARILLMLNYRPDFVHDWGRRSCYSQITMAPLTATVSAEFVDALLGNHPSVESLRARLVANTGGNPFFVEECVRSLANSGAVAGDRGAYRAERALESLTLPETVQAVIAARIDQLELIDRTLLRVAAVIGNEVPFRLLRAVGGLDDDALRAALSRLQASEFLIEMTLSSSAWYRFKHALTNEVAYNTLLQQTRRELHARIVGALEEQSAGATDEHIEALAYHSSRGDVWEKAAAYGRRAGTKAVDRAAYRVAVARFSEALTALGRLPETPVRIAREIDLRFDMRNTLFVLGEHGRLMEHLRPAEALAERTNDTLRRGLAALHIGGWFWYDGQQRASLDAGQRALSIAREIGNDELAALAWYRIGQSHHASGDYRAAIDAFLKTTAMLERADRVDVTGFGGYPYAFCCSFLAWSFAELGAFRSAREWGARGWHFAIERNHSYTQSVMAFGLGVSQIREGRFNEARDVLETGLEHYEVGKVAVTFSWVASPLGYAYAALGEFERGLDFLTRALAVDQPQLLRSRLELYLAEASLMAGRVDQAFEAACRGNELAEENGERAQVAWAERLLGDVVSARDPIVAERHYERSIAIARPLELRGELTAALLGRSRLSLVDGRLAEARELSSEAASLAAPAPTVS